VQVSTSAPHSAPPAACAAYGTQASIADSAKSAAPVRSFLFFRMRTAEIASLEFVDKEITP
jgi:hypothetical protein